MHRLPLLLVFFALLFSSCSRDRVIYEEVYNVEGGTWKHGQLHNFEFEVSDTSANYRLLLYLEFAIDYRWQNFYTQITTTFPGDSVRSDVLSLELASKSGEWFGNCNGEECNLTIPLQENVRFHQQGRYSIAFDQYMREDVLDGIHAIGLKLIAPRPD